MLIKNTVAITSDKGETYIFFQEESVEVKLYEIHNDIIYGRFGAAPCSWFTSGAIHSNGHKITRVKQLVASK